MTEQIEKAEKLDKLTKLQQKIEKMESQERARKIQLQKLKKQQDEALNKANDKKRTAIFDFAQKIGVFDLDEQVIKAALQSLVNANPVQK